MASFIKANKKRDEFFIFWQNKYINIYNTKINRLEILML